MEPTQLAEKPLALKIKPRKALTKQFLDLVHSPRTDKLIAQTNWQASIAFSDVTVQRSVGLK